MLPHAAHARQVVLELGELDLELPLGAGCMLGEDVEDQLGAVDDPGGEGVLERTLLHGVELVVDDEYLRGRLTVDTLQLLQLPLADVRARIGMHAMLHELADGIDARSPRELAQLRELVLGVGPLRQHGDREPALGLHARERIGLALRHQRKV